MAILVSKLDVLGIRKVPFFPFMSGLTKVPLFAATLVPTSSDTQARGKYGPEKGRGGPVSCGQAIHVPVTWQTPASRPLLIH